MSDCRCCGARLRRAKPDRARVNRVHAGEEDEPAVFKGYDDPRKPWTACCPCGYISWHSSERAGWRAIGKHMRAYEAQSSTETPRSVGGSA